MRALLLTAMHSGAGKTVTACAILAALKRRGLRLSAFKCGPDYIDPMFHSRVLGIPCRNLDPFLQGEEGMRRSLRRAEGDFALLEGAMGYYDGLADSTEASAYDAARRLKVPAVLVLRPKGASLSLAAQVRGMLNFREESGIRALLLADCPDRYADRLSPLLERETGLPVLGALPPMEAARFESRHLGLISADEIADLAERMDALGRAAEEHLALDRLLSLSREVERPAGILPQPKTVCRIAAARDEAFCFHYADSLDALRESGAEVVFFSPLRDAALPEDIHGLLLCGGYPELHAEALAKNESLRRAICEAVSAGLPTLAECGGFLYLQQRLRDASGKAHTMCGALPGEGFPTGQLQRFGYQRLCAGEDSLLFRAGERIPAHEFHHWDTSAPGAALLSKKPDGQSWPCGYASGSLYAAFPHLHLDGETPLAERFVKACAAWKASGN